MIRSPTSPARTSTSRAAARARSPQPIKVDKEVVAGDTAELDTFAIAVAATVTLMFVTVLLVAGSLALEREENAFAAAHPRRSSAPPACSPRRSCSGSSASLVVTLLMLGRR